LVGIVLGDIGVFVKIDVDILRPTVLVIALIVAAVIALIVAAVIACHRGSAVANEPAMCGCRHTFPPIEHCMPQCPGVCGVHFQDGGWTGYKLVFIDIGHLAPLFFDE
jgi:hypothetical protein